jgi:hypothetical protein
MTAPQRHVGLALRRNTSLLWRVLMGPLGSKGGPCRTRVEPGGCPGLGSCRAVECVRQWSPQPAVENIIHVWQGPMLCASPANPCLRHNGSELCGTASPDPCPASVHVCLARLTSAVAVRLLYVAGNGDETLASGARCNCKLPVDIHFPRHQTGDQSQAPSSRNALAEHARL